MNLWNLGLESSRPALEQLCNKEYKQKSSVELLVYFLTDFIHF